MILLQKIRRQSLIICARKKLFRIEGELEVMHSIRRINPMATKNSANAILIRIAESGDLHFLKAHDKHISESELKNAIGRGHVLMAEKSGETVGWLRYNYFWDNTPFMNMLFISSEHRGKKYGTSLVAYWEGQMKNSGFNAVMTSTQANECAQHFYQKLGYKVIGGFLMGNEPYELMLAKEI